MKLSTTLIGATLVAATLGFSEPAAARSNVGVYIGPGGVAISVDTYRRYCRDEWYRRRHWDRCSRFYGRDYRYDSNYRHHKRHRHWNDRYHRWDWD